MYKKLCKKIVNKKAKIAIIGLGYVGLPLCVTFAKKGFDVTGIDINKRRLDNINKGISYIVDVSDDELKRVLQEERFKVSADFSTIRHMDVVIICVPTPLSKKRVPDISYIKKAVINVKDNIKRGQIIVLESTTYPGTTKEILLPILESTGLIEGKDFYLCFSPERIDPANRFYKTENTPKVIGGISKDSTQIARLLYENVVSQVVPVSSAGAAEMVKLLENTFRIVNIALVNEIAILCEKLNLDIWEIIEAAKTKPFGYMPFYPGPGVGGHCIPVDPLYLSWKAKKHGFKTRFIDLASSINEAMPRYVVKRLEEILSYRKHRMKNANILIVGVAYKAGVKDLRESPGIEIMKLLLKKKAKISYYDPHFPYLKINGLDMKPIKMTSRLLRRFDCVLIVTDHRDIDYKLLSKYSKYVFDTRNIFGRLGIEGRNIIRL